MTENHVRQLRRLALVIPIAIPPILLGFATASARLGWDVVASARASAICVMVLLAAVIYTPLLLPYPQADRRRGFVIFWFCLSAFFNATWQIPLTLFRSVITTAEPTHANLFKFIAWWGYGFADAHYGRVTGWMMAEELWWLLAIAMSIVGLVELRRGREARAFLWLGIAGALEAYNASLYMVHDHFVGGFSNIPSGSLVSLVLYWGFNPLWTLASLLASVFSFRFLLERAERPLPA